MDKLSIKKYAENTQWKNAMLLLGVLLVFIIFNIQIGKKEDTVRVIVASHEIKAGEVLDKKRDLAPYEITISEYNKLNSIVNSVSKEKIAPLVLASEVDKIDGKFVCNYTPAGTMFRRSSITAKSLAINPYIANIPDSTYEIYTLPFSAEGVNTRLLLPGSNIRIRGVMSVKNEFVAEVREMIEAKESNIDKGLPIPQDGQSVIRTFAPEAQGVSGKTSAVATDVPVAEIIFDKIKVADILNNNNESVLEILMALSNLPLNNRIELLRTSVDSEDSESSNTFAKRIMPTKLVLVVDRKSASQLAEFENLGSMEFKYTILAEDTNDSTYIKLRSVSDDIYSFVENYKAVSK